MASKTDFIEFVCDQIQGVGSIRYRKMFGEYMIYINDKPILLVCQNTVYVKKLPCIENHMVEAEEGIPYQGAKVHYILEIDNRDFSKEIINILEQVIEVPKPRKKKIKE